MKRVFVCFVYTRNLFKGSMKVLVDFPEDSCFIVDLNTGETNGKISGD